MSKLTASRINAHSACWLHVLPGLQLKPFSHVSPEEVTLQVSASWADPLDIPTDWVIRQPYPNPLYLVAGTTDSHLGYVVSLFEEAHRGGTGTVTFHWTVASSHTSTQLQIEHCFDLTFMTGKGNLYSMDIANWWPQSEFSRQQSVPQIGRNRFSTVCPQGISAWRKAQTDEDIGKRGRRLRIQESVCLPPITLAECWTFDVYGVGAKDKFMELMG